MATLDQAQEAEISILLLGDSEVGKSTVLSRITHPTANSLPTLPDLSQPFNIDLRTRKASYRLLLSDTSSPENYTLLRPHVLILCYSIPDRSTLASVQSRWKHLVETHFNFDEAIPVMLLGLKRDLRRLNDPKMVLPQEAVRVAAEMRCDRYAECSAVTGELCREMWEDVVQMAVGTQSASGGKSAGTSCVLL